MEIMGIDGGWMVVRLLGPWARVERSLGVWTLLARAWYYHQSTIMIDYFYTAQDWERTNATILAPSVKLPAPKVNNRSACVSRASLTISSTSDHSVWVFIPLRTPATLSLPRAEVSRSNASVLRDNDPEQIT